MAFKIAEAFVEITTHGSGAVLGTLGRIRGAAMGLLAPFGQIGSLMGPLSGALGALAFPVGFGAGLTYAVKQFADAEQAAARLGAVFESTGNRAGWTVDQVKALGSEIQSVSRIGDDEVTLAAARLATLESIQGDIFGRALKSSASLAVFLGSDMTNATVQLGRALESPADGLRKLARAGIMFTDAQEAQIKKLAETGRVAEAQAMILDTLDGKIGKLAEADLNTLTGQFAALKNQIGDLFESFGGNAQGPLMTAVKMLRDVVETVQFVHDQWSTIWGLMANETGRHLAVALDYVTVTFANMKAAVINFGADAAVWFMKLGVDLGSGLSVAGSVWDAFIAMLTGSTGSVTSEMTNAFISMFKHLGQAAFDFGAVIFKALTFDFAGMKESYAKLMADIVGVAIDAMNVATSKEMDGLAAANAAAKAGLDAARDANRAGYAGFNTDELNKHFDEEQRKILDAMAQGPDAGKHGAGAGVAGANADQDSGAKKASIFGIDQLWSTIQSGATDKKLLKAAEQQAADLKDIKENGIKVKGGMGGAAVQPG